MFVYVNNLLWLFRMEPHTFEKKMVRCLLESSQLGTSPPSQSIKRKTHIIKRTIKYK